MNFNFIWSSQHLSYILSSYFFLTIISQLRLHIDTIIFIKILSILLILDNFIKTIIFSFTNLIYFKDKHGRACTYSTGPLATAAVSDVSVAVSSVSAIAETGRAELTAAECSLSSSCRGFEDMDRGHRRRPHQLQKRLAF